MRLVRLITISAVLTTALLQSQNDSARTGSFEKRPFQLSFITPFGTNGMASHKTINHVSLNILAGVSAGVQGFEAGSIANVTLHDVKGAQFAGVSNIVLGNVKGGQFASCFNYCGGHLNGVMYSGFANLNLSGMEGGQIAAFFNLSRGGGLGTQVSAFSNIALGDLKGAQVAAFANIATGNISGAQVSGFINIAKRVKGTQVGIVNIADSVDGASIGLFNFIRHGKHQLELAADEMFYANLSYRTGTNAFHNIITAGFKPGSADNLWQFGYGAGTTFRMSQSLWGDMSATIHHVNAGGFYFGTSELMRLYLGVEYKLMEKISVAAGPTFNFYVSDALISDYDPAIKRAAPYHQFSHTTADDFNLKGWIGGRIALRFL